MLQTGWDDKAFRSKPVGNGGGKLGGPQQPQYPSAVNRHRMSQLGMFPANRDAPEVPQIPSRYGPPPPQGRGGNGGYQPGSYEMERTPSPGEYASLMRGAAMQSPSSPGFGPSVYGHSSAVSGPAGQQGVTHARQRSGGGGQGVLPPRGGGPNGSGMRPPPSGNGRPGPPPPPNGGGGPPARNYHARFG